MKIKFALISSIACFAFAVPNFALANSQCQTKEICAIGEKCQCMIVGGTSERYFYFKFPSMRKGQQYECSFISKPVNITFSTTESHFPAGSTYAGSGSYPRTPMQLTVDTKNMTKAKDTFIAKFSVFDTHGYSPEVTFSCNLKS